MASPILLIELLIRLVTAERARSAPEPTPSIPSAESDGRGELLSKSIYLVPGALGASEVVKSLGLFQVSLGDRPGGACIRPWPARPGSDQHRTGVRPARHQRRACLFQMTGAFR